MNRVFEENYINASFDVDFLINSRKSSPTYDDTYKYVWIWPYFSAYSGSGVELQSCSSTVDDVK